MDPVKIVVSIIVSIAILIFIAGIRIVRPTQRGLIERLGKYRQYALPGFHWVIPIIDRMILVNITKQMVVFQKTVIL